MNFSYHADSRHRRNKNHQENLRPLNFLKENLLITIHVLIINDRNNFTRVAKIFNLTSCMFNLFNENQKEILEKRFCSLHFFTFGT